MKMTHEEMDLEVADAQHYLPHFKLDRCRHESVSMTSLWLFDAEGKQIGSCSRTDNGGWRASHMHKGQLVAQRHIFLMLDALDYIAARHAFFVKTLLRARV
jgi:hypothetical protein